MSRRGFASVLLFLVFNLAYGQSFEVNVTSNFPIRALPGEIGTVIIKVNNPDTTALKLVPSYVKNENLSCIMCNMAVSIPPKTEKSVIIPLMVNKNARPGSIKFKYRLNAPDSNFIEKEFEIEVKKKVDFTLSMINMPEFVRAGESIKAQAVIQNNSNITGSFKIEKFGFTDKLPAVVQLKQGENITYNLSMITDVNITKPDYATYGLRITSLDDSMRTHDVFHSTYIFPVTEGKQSPYFSIPGSVKINYFLNNTGNKSTATGYQFDIFFKGSLDQKNKQKVELSIRGPNRFSSSTLGTYDEYYFNYKNDRYEGHIGDKVFSLTPLTEVSRFGRGIQVSNNYDSNITFGMFYVRPRFNSSIKQEYAAYGTFLLKSKAKVGLNILTKESPDKANNSVLTSITGEYSVLNYYSFDVEVAQSFSQSLIDFGFRTNGMYKRRRLSFNFSTIVTGKDFAGYYRNTNFFVFNSSYVVDKKTDFNFNYNKDFQNALLDSIVRAAPSNNSYFFGFTRRMDHNLNSRILYRNSALKDKSALQSFDYKSNQLQISINQKINTFNYNFVADYGLNRNLKYSEDSSLSTASNIYLELQYLYSRKFFISLFQNFANSNRYSYKNENSIFYGGSLGFNIGKSIGATIRYQSNYFPEEYYRNRDAVDLRLRYAGTKRLDFAVATRYVFLANEADKKELYVQFSSSYKINLPIKKIASYGKITGVIRSKTGKSVKDILVHLNGRTAVTRKDGSFAFANVPAGNYLLYVDQTSLLLNEIIEQITPVKVEVLEGKTSVVNMDIIAAAKIVGTVKVTFKKGAYYDDTLVNGVPPLVLILKSEYESQTIVSDMDGTFYFKNLKPGKWKLQVYDNMLEGKYVVEKEQHVFDIITGQTINLELRIMKKAKKIKFQQPKK